MRYDEEEDLAEGVVHPQVDASGERREAVRRGGPHGERRGILLGVMVGGVVGGLLALLARPLPVPLSLLGPACGVLAIGAGVWAGWQMPQRGWRTSPLCLGLLSGSAAFLIGSIGLPLFAKPLSGDTFLALVQSVALCAMSGLAMALGERGARRWKQQRMQAAAGGILALPSFRREVRTVLVVYDERTGGDAALEMGILLARGSGAELLLLSVAEAIPQYAGTVSEVDAAMSLQAELLYEQQRRAVAQVARQGITRYRAIIEAGQAASHIVQTARRHQADVIVLGQPHGSRLAGRGRNATIAHVLRDAPCAVLQVHLPRQRYTQEGVHELV